MNTTLDTLMPAQHTHESSSTDQFDGEGVKAVSFLPSRRRRETRARDELSEIERMMIVESVRLRRAHEARKSSIYNELFGMRSNK